MKDYLNSNESLQLMAFQKVIEISKKFIDGNLMSKEEKTNLKKAVTYLDKSITSVKSRLNDKAKKAFERSQIGAGFHICSNTEIEVYRKRRSSEIDAAYEENKEYFKLVGLTMHYSCRGCKKDCHECLIYDHFEENYIPEFIGKELNCKYAYRSDDVEDRTRNNGQSNGECQAKVKDSRAKESKENRKQKSTPSKNKK
ncbi:DUF5651 domain-containing protein [Clostridium beijerinckii]|uniref:DUF5651 domain-containing protein n=1 Tax=Clostridium beijerinckii TaxID=1520 RepID=UPI002225E392|nr:DUF5651 domain-containing protein [Clostridium beijerinckii]UYZ36773.1 DUF5651 domain-containing protein [Clostridium beijerinckii]